MRGLLQIIALMGTFSGALSAAQDRPGTTPLKVTEEQLRTIQQLEGQEIEIAGVSRHVGSERVFTVGKNAGRETLVLLFNPSVDTANLGDTLVITGTVRRFNPETFARDYKTFRAADFSQIPVGAFVIVASAVRNLDGAQLPVSPKE